MCVLEFGATLHPEMRETSQIDADLVELALQACRANHERALAQRLAIDEEIAQWELKIQKLENLIPSHRSVDSTKNAGSISTEWRTPTGRIPHGRSEQLILRFLQTRNAAGATLREIANSTGVKYPTAHRLVKILERRHRVKRAENSRWRLVTP